MLRLSSGLVLLAGLLLLSACGTPATSPRVGPGFVNGKPVHPTVKMGDPYTVNGETYVPKYQPNYSEEGEASWYGPGFHGKSTANGERFNTGDMTAAHRTLPLPSMVRVTNMKNGRSVVVRVNDRGPFASDRIIDVSKAAAEQLDMIRSGVAHVKVEYLPIETEQYIAQLGTGKSPEQIAWEEKHTRKPIQVAANGDSWYSAAAKPSGVVSQETKQAADFSGVTSTDLPPPTPSAPAPAVAPIQAISPSSPEPISTGSIPSAPPMSEGNRSYGASPFDAVDGAAHAPKPAPVPASSLPPPAPPKAVASTSPATADPNAGSVARGTYIQVGAFGNQANAEKIGRQFTNAHIQGIPPEAPKVYRVRLGPFTDRYSAENMLLEVREKVPDAQLVEQ